MLQFLGANRGHRCRKAWPRAPGIEYNSDRVELSKRNAVKEGVADKARFIQADIFKRDFSQDTVITMFLLISIHLQLRPQILNLKPLCRILPRWKIASIKFSCEEWGRAFLSNSGGCHETE